MTYYFADENLSILTEREIEVLRASFNRAVFEVSKNFPQKGLVISGKRVSKDEFLSNAVYYYKNGYSHYIVISVIPQKIADGSLEKERIEKERLENAQKVFEMAKKIIADTNGTFRYPLSDYEKKQKEKQYAEWCNKKEEQYTREKIYDTFSKTNSQSHQRQNDNDSTFQRDYDTASYVMDILSSNSSYSNDSYSSSD